METKAAGEFFVDPAVGGVGYNGIFEVKLDRYKDFSLALELMLGGKSYISESFVPHMKPRVA